MDLIERIQIAVAAHYGVSCLDILSPRRPAAVAMPRHVAMFLAKTITKRSLPDVGRWFGGRDHTTVLHAVRKIEAMMQRDATFRAEIEGLRRSMQRRWLNEEMLATIGEADVRPADHPGDPRR